MVTIATGLQEGRLALHRRCNDAFLGDQQLTPRQKTKIVAILYELRKLDYLVVLVGQNVPGRAVGRLAWAIGPGRRSPRRFLSS